MRRRRISVKQSMEGDIRMKGIAVYYSFEGNSEAAARRAVELTHAVLVRITAEEEPPKTGLKTYLAGGAQVMRGFRPKIHIPTADFDSADTVILVCPVWAGHMAPAMAAYLEKKPFSGKNVVLIGCSASGNAEKMFAQMEALLADNTVAGKCSLKDPLKHPEELKKIDTLMKGLL